MFYIIPPIVALLILIYVTRKKNLLISDWMSSLHEHPKKIATCIYALQSLSDQAFKGVLFILFHCLLYLFIPLDSAKPLEELQGRIDNILKVLYTIPFLIAVTSSFKLYSFNKLLKLLEIGEKEHREAMRLSLTSSLAKIVLLICLILFLSLV